MREDFFINFREATTNVSSAGDSLFRLFNCSFLFPLRPQPRKRKDENNRERLNLADDINTKREDRLVISRWCVIYSRLIAPWFLNDDSSSKAGRRDSRESELMEANKLVPDLHCEEFLPDSKS